MGAQVMLLVVVMVNFLLLVQSSVFNRTAFPPDFAFGAASAAYQYEGAAFEGGKGLSVWDTFTHQFPGKIINGDNGDVADDFYHRYKEDVKLMDDIGLDAFRFSISWPRVLPKGKLSGGVNKEGVAFYNNLIDELVSKGIKPFVTIYHWDLPQALQDEYGGFLHPQITKDFQDFAELCFKEFGDRVKHWITFNEPYSFIVFGYEMGDHAPGRCSSWMNKSCPAGDSTTEPYIVAHNMLLCHALAVKLYKQKYQASQKGVIGITLVTHWFVPFSASKENKRAAQRALDFMLGWHMDPLAFGEYPQSMRTMVQKRLPKFSAEEANLVKGSFDFIGINYYTANYAADTKLASTINHSYSTDSRLNLTTIRNGRPIGAPTEVSIFYVYPKGLRDLLVYVKKKYNNPTIYVTENGIGENDMGIVNQGVNDTARISFYYRHILAIKDAIKQGVNVKGFFPWSFLDTFEWASGFTQRFGLNYVDYKDGLKRYPKHSAMWFKKFLAGNN